MEAIIIQKTDDGYFIVDTTAEVANRAATFAPTSGASTQEDCRTGLKKFGIPDNVIEQAIHRADETGSAIIQLDGGAWHLAATNFEAISALHELKQKNLRPEDMTFVTSTLDRHEKGERLTRSDILRISDLLKQ
jgi:hypothetical protein